MLMKDFIGTKRIKAAPMNRGNYNIYRGWVLSAGECGGDHGFLVEEKDTPVNHLDHGGHITWLPASVFLKTYKATSGLTLGLALEALQSGCAVARKGWNGKGVFLRISHPGISALMTQAFIYIDTVGLETDNPDAARCRVPWLPSQTDLLATDWVIL